MANSNVNIAEKLFAYIHYGKDLKDPIKGVYANSLIFIGDEERLYVPAVNTYVGISKYAFNDVLNDIDAIENRIDELETSLASDKVSKIYVDWNQTHASNFGVMTGKDEWDDEFALKNEITLRGVHDYDPETGLSYGASNKNYVWKSAHDTYTSNHATLYQSYSASTLATSGITITPHFGEMKPYTNQETGQTTSYRVGNWIEIDDKLTWAYMTSAYAYSISFAQNYTASEVDRLYHNLLGDSKPTYVPVSFASVFTDISEQFNSLTSDEQLNYVAPDGKTLVTPQGDPTKHFLIDSTGEYFYATYTGASVESETEKEYHSIRAEELKTNLTSGTPAFPAGVVTDSDGFGGTYPQLYVLDEQYNSSYNMNIKDGIETLKEVAYLLDILSDGTLGKTTYVTYGEWKANPDLVDSSWEPAEDEHGNAIEQTTVDGVTYTRVNAGVNPADSENYAFYTTTANPDTLGIQIAYSIAGNQKQIEDLHYHAELAEKGKTTLRSIQHTDENFGAINLVGGTRSWTDTDTNQGASSFNGSIDHPNSNTGNSYLVGDVNIKLDLNTAYTYTTVYYPDGGNLYPHKIDAFGVEWYGTYTKADMSKLSEDPDGTTYYKVVEGVVTPLGPDEFIQDVHNQPAGTQYWWNPGAEGNVSVANAEQNAQYYPIDISEFIALSNTGKVYDDAPQTKEQMIASGTGGIFYVADSSTPSGYKVLVNASQTDAITALTNAKNGPDHVSTVYYVFEHKDSIIHAERGENKLATTSWVGAYVDETLTELNASLQDNLAKAKEYTDKRINELDSEYIYSDFKAAYWTSYVSYWKDVTGDNDLGIEGTPSYTSAYDREYKAFREAGEAGESVVYKVAADGQQGEAVVRLSYIANSQYLFNVKEENGIVTAEARELPTDTLKTNVSVWGAENNFEPNRFKYTAITGLSAEEDAETDLLTRLYHHGFGGDNQVFVETTETTYQPVAYNEPGVDLTGVLYEYDSESNVYVLYDNINNGIPNYANPADKKWRQLYREAHVYKELNLDDAEDATATRSSVKIGDYTLTLSGGEINVTGGNAVASAKLLMIDATNKPAEKVEYLTTENKHFSYEDNGHGENEFTVTAHITKIEDATPTNSGFADAYDVKEYINNLIKIVDISATVTQAQISKSDKGFKRVSLANTEDGAQLWTRSATGDSVQYSPVTAGTESKSWYFIDNNEYYGQSADGFNSTEWDKTHAPLGDVWIVQQYNALLGSEQQTADYNPGTHDYYIQTEFPSNNAQNQELSVFFD